jgi:hypothetical protein
MRCTAMLSQVIQHVSHRSVGRMAGPDFQVRERLVYCLGDARITAAREQGKWVQVDNLLHS